MTDKEKQLKEWALNLSEDEQLAVYKVVHSKKNVEYWKKNHKKGSKKNK